MTYGNVGKNMQNEEFVKISVVIPSFNQGEFIERTLCSVFDQNYPNIEIIVVDGGSSDSSVEIIRKYEKHLSYWHSRKDSGQSNAINFGFRKATGRFKTWLNSDDVFMPGALYKVNEFIHCYPDCRWFSGNTLWIDRNDRILRAGKTEQRGRFFRSRILPAVGPSAFAREDLLEQYGLLREDFHYMMDTEMWYRWSNAGEWSIKLPIYVWGLRLHENAKMSGHNFSGSPMADPNHPKRIQRRKEAEVLDGLIGPHTGMDKIMFYCNKICDGSIWSRFTDHSLSGKIWMDVFWGDTK